MFSSVCNDWFCLYLLALNPLAIINPLEFTSLSNYWLAVILVPLTIFSMTVFNSKTSSFGFLLFRSANVFNWLEKVRICLAIIVFPFRSLKSGLSLWDAVRCSALGGLHYFLLQTDKEKKEKKENACFHLHTSWSAAQPHNFFWVLPYSPSRSVLEVFITRVEAEGSYLKACSQWSTVSKGFVFFLYF